MNIGWVALIAGLAIFLGAHSVRIFAEDWRTAQVARLGEKGWKGVYSLVSLIGLVLLIWGFGQARLEPVVLWSTPLWTRHLAALLTLLAFVLIAAAEVPGNAIRANLKHPMVLGVKVWALAHLLANNTLADLILFGAFLLWSVFDFRSARRRPADLGAEPVSAARTALVVVGGGLAWAAFAGFGHQWLIGVRPFA
jgi:uncharacterized membrane protein